MNIKHLPILILLICMCKFALGYERPAKNYKMLKSVDVTTVDEKGTAVHVTERVLKITSDAGRVELAMHKVMMTTSSDKFNLIEAFVNNGGQKFKISPREVKISHNHVAEFGLVDIPEAVIPLSNLQVNSEIHLKYSITSTPLIGNLFAATVGISNNELATEESYSINSKIPLQIYEDNPGPFYQINRMKINGYDSVTLRPTEKAYLFENNKVETDFVMASNSPTWLSINNLLASKYNSIIDAPLPPAFKQIVNDSKTLLTSKEKIEFVAKSLAKIISYSGNWVTNDGRFLPQGHNVVAKKGQGDCKDYSASMTGILRKIGFTANAALTFRSSRYTGHDRTQKMSAVPNIATFNHVIVWAKDAEGKVWWVDPTNPVVIANVLLPDILGNYALIIDGKSDNVTMLPAKNDIPSDISLEQSVSINPDNSISGTGNIVMSANSYNSLIANARFQTADGAKSIFSRLLNPISKIQMELKKDDNKDFAYSYSLRASDWVLEKQKNKYFVSMIPLTGVLMGMFPKSENDLGEVGTTKFVTHVLKEKQVDSIDAGCLARSPWVDVDRIVENKPTEFTITDIIQVKQRYISKADASTDNYSVYYGQIMSCLGKSKIPMFIDPSNKTAEMLAEEKMKLPAFENMTDKDAIEIEKIRYPNLRSHFLVKRYRYYNAKLEKNPKDTEALQKTAFAIQRLGLLMGQSYLPAYMDESIARLNKAIEYSEKTASSRIYRDKVYALLYQKNFNEASDVFKILNAAYPNNFDTCMSAFRISYDWQKYDLAEQWVREGEALGTDDEQMELFHEEYAMLLEKQKRFLDMVPHREYILKKYPSNAWAYHNLALTYMELKDYDKTISLEESAIALMDFGAARGAMAWAYYHKAVQQKKRSPAAAADPEVEKLLLGAIKWDPVHVKSLSMLVKICLDDYKATQNPARLSQGKDYLHRAIAKEPDNTFLQKMLRAYQKIDSRTAATPGV